MLSKELFTEFPNLPEKAKALILVQDTKIKELETKIQTQDAKIQTQDAKIQTQDEKIQELERRLNLNSKNSNKPPSSDVFHKPNPKSLRKKSGKKPGGQKGHPGHNLKQVDNPDHVVSIECNSCPDCGGDLSEQPVKKEIKRQVIDLPTPKMETTEYQSPKKYCPRCKKYVHGEFPSNVTQPVEYGQRIKAQTVYDDVYQYMPTNRIQEKILDTYHHYLSEGTICNFLKEAHKILEPTEEWIIQGLIKSTILHSDETGFRCLAKLFWLHVASNKKLTYYGFHQKRGNQAMDDFGILSNFRGTLIHDGWKSYKKYACKHGLCNAHHLRELDYFVEVEEQPWAVDLVSYLVGYKDISDDARSRGSPLTDEEIADFESAYDKLIEKALKQYEAEMETLSGNNKRGRKKKSRAVHLLIRLQDKDAVLGFLRDLNVPFDNNQGERDIRMAKLKQKISGCFRSFQGGQIFCRIRGYLSTCRKQDKPILEALESVFQGDPWMPEINFSAS